MVLSVSAPKEVRTGLLSSPDELKTHMCLDCRYRGRVSGTTGTGANLRSCIYVHIYLDLALPTYSSTVLPNHFTHPQDVRLSHMP